MATLKYIDNFEWEIESTMAKLATVAAQANEPAKTFDKNVLAVCSTYPALLSTEQGQATYNKYMAGFSQQP